MQRHPDNSSNSNSPEDRDDDGGDEGSNVRQNEVSDQIQELARTPIPAVPPPPSSSSTTTTTTTTNSNSSQAQSSDDFGRTRGDRVGTATDVLMASKSGNGNGNGNGSVVKNDSDFFSMMDTSNLLLFQKRVADAECQFQTGESFVDAITGVIAVLSSVTAGFYLPDFEPQHLFFIQRAIPRLVQALQMRCFLQPHMIPHVMVFFERVLDLIILSISQSDPTNDPLGLANSTVGLLEVLDWIFSPSSSFYKHFGVYSKNTPLLQEDLRMLEKEDREMRKTSIDSLSNTSTLSLSSLSTATSISNFEASNSPSSDLEILQLEETVKEPLWMNNYERFVFASPQTKYQKTLSAYFFRNINYFGRHGGFGSIIRRMAAILNNLTTTTTTTPPSSSTSNENGKSSSSSSSSSSSTSSNNSGSNNRPLSLLKHLLRPLMRIMIALTRPFSSELIPVIHNRMLPILLFEKNGECPFLLVENRPLITELTNIMQLMLRYHKPKQANEILDNLWLQICIRHLRSKNLDKRLLGMADLRALINELMGVNPASGSGSGFGFGGGNGGNVGGVGGFGKNAGRGIGGEWASDNASRGTVQPQASALPGPSTAATSASSANNGSSSNTFFGGITSALGVNSFNLPNVSAKSTIQFISSNSNLFGSAFKEGRSITTRSLARWILQNGLVEEVFFGANIHTEIVRQSRHVLLFLLQERSLTTQHIDVIWRAFEKEHESVGCALLDLIVVITPFLSVNLLNHCWSHVEQMPVSAFDDDMLKFVLDFSAKCFSNVEVCKIKEKKRKWYGLELFWNLLQDGEKPLDSMKEKPDDSGIVPTVKRRAFECMSTLIRSPECESQRKRFLKACINNLLSQVSVAQSLSLMIVIIETFPNATSSSSALTGTVNTSNASNFNFRSKTMWTRKRRQIIEHYNDKYKLVDLFFLELANYKTKFSQHFIGSMAATIDSGASTAVVGVSDELPPPKSAPQPTPTSDTPSPLNSEENKTSVGEIPPNLTTQNTRITPNGGLASANLISEHSRQIDVRLKFMAHVLANSNITLTYANASRMWELLYPSKSTAHIEGDQETASAEYFISASDIVIAAEERDRFLQWMEMSKNIFNPHRGTGVFSDQVTEKLFQDKLQHIDPAEISKQEFAVFFSFFVYLNVHANNLELICFQSPTRSTSVWGSTELQVNNDDLKGVEFLRNVALLASNDDISSQARRYLNRLHFKYSRDLRQFAASYRERYITECLSRLSEASGRLSRVQTDASEAVATHSGSSLNPKHQERMISRCIQLLLEYISLFEPSFSPSSQNSGFDNPEIGQLIIRAHLASNSSLPPPTAALTAQSSPNASDAASAIATTTFTFRAVLISMSPVDTLETLAQLLATEIGTNGYKQIRLFAGDKEFDFSLEVTRRTMIGELLFDWKDTVLTVIKRMNKETPSKEGGTTESITSTPQLKFVADSADFQPQEFVVRSTIISEEDAFPSRILSRDAYFKQLLELLDNPSPVVADMIWKLVSRLPFNPTSARTLTDFPDLSSAIFVQSQPSFYDWRSLIDSRHSIYRLLYSLKIILHNLCATPSSSAILSSDSTSDWTTRFVRLGGVRYLLHAVLLNSAFFNPQTPNAFSTPVVRECTSTLLSVLAKTLPGAYRSEIQTIASQHDEQISGAHLKTPDLVALAEHILRVLTHPGWHSPQQPQDKAPAPTEPQQPATAPSDSSALALSKCFEMLLVALPLAPTAIMSCVYNSQKILLDWMTTVVLCGDDAAVRTAVGDGFFQLISRGEDLLLMSATSEHLASPREKFLPFLFSFVVSGETDRRPNTCEQFFCLVERCLAIGKLPTGLFEIDSVLIGICNRIVTRPIQESRDFRNTDAVLVGLLNVARVLVQIKPDTMSGQRQFVHELFKCLFDMASWSNQGPLAPPKCKSQKSRAAAFSLLVECCKEDHALWNDVASSLVIPLLNNITCGRSPNMWDYDPGMFEKSSTGYVGLKNQGATCYMNSVLQHLFAVRRFRRDIFEADTNLAPSLSEDNSPTSTSPTSTDEISTGNAMTRNRTPREKESVTLLYEFQKVFGNLQESQMRFYNTHEFCASCRGADGLPIDVRQQQDANEFFNVLTDRLEEALKLLKHNNVIREIFQGTLLNQVIILPDSDLQADQIPPPSEREESFLSISLEVKNKRNITESLELYTQGEILDGENKYFSSDLQRHVRAHKRACFKELPPVLVCHLKRFEFDYSKMRHIKVNDRCEFPFLLDMEPYTVEGVARRENQPLQTPIDVKKRAESGYYNYELIGVIVHSGTADGGHYYSYIMDRMQPATSAGSKSSYVWHEFNDTIVRVFDVKHLPRECFGGVEEISFREEGRPPVMRQFHRSNNAYLLFYRRMDGDPYVDEAPSPNGTITPHDSVDVDLEPQVESAQGSGFPTAASNRWRSKSILALRFLVKLSRIARQREAEFSRRNGMPSGIKNMIWKENELFLRNRAVYSAEFDEFLWRMIEVSKDLSEADVSQAPFEGSCLATELAMRYILDVLIRSRERPKHVKWFPRLQRLINGNITACKWLLSMASSTPTWLHEMLIKCPFVEVRTNFVDLLIGCIRTLSLVESCFVKSEQQTQTQQQQQLPPPNGLPGTGDLFVSTSESDTIVPVKAEPSHKEKRPVVAILIDNVIELLCNTNPESSTSISGITGYKYWSSMLYCSPDSLLLFLRQFAQVGAEERRYLLEKDLISALVVLVTGDKGDNVAMNYPFMMAGRGYAGLSKSAMENILSISSMLIRSCDAESPKEKGSPPTFIPGLVNYRLSQKSRTKFFNRQFFSSLIHEGIHLEAISEVLLHWCWENNPVSFNFAKLIIDKLPDVPHDRYPSYLQVLGNLLGLQDSIAKERVRTILDYFMGQIMQKGRMEQGAPTFACIKFLSNQTPFNENVKAWLFEHMRDLERICEYHGWSLKHK